MASILSNDDTDDLNIGLVYSNLFVTTVLVASQFLHLYSSNHSSMYVGLFIVFEYSYSWSLSGNSSDAVWIAPQ